MKQAEDKVIGAKTSIPEGTHFNHLHDTIINDLHDTIINDLHYPIINDLHDTVKNGFILGVEDDDALDMFADSLDEAKVQNGKENKSENKTDNKSPKMLVDEVMWEFKWEDDPGLNLIFKFFKNIFFI